MSADFVPDPAVWEQRGSKGYWYRIRDSRRYQPRVLAVCSRCGDPALLRRDSQFCSRSCAASGDRKSRVGYNGAHVRVRVARGSASDHECADCGHQAEDWSYDGLDPDELTGVDGLQGAGCKYSLKPEFYVPRCRRCHRLHDGHLGEGNGSAKLTDAQRRGVLASVLRPGTSDIRELAERVGVHQSTIRKIRRGRC